MIEQEGYTRGQALADWRATMHRMLSAAIECGCCFNVQAGEHRLYGNPEAVEKALLLLPESVRSTVERQRMGHHFLKASWENDYAAL